MKVEVKKVDEIKREIKIQVPKERVTIKLEEVYKSIGKEAKIKGFRPGKVPRHVLEQHHAPLAQDEMIKGLVPEAYQQSVLDQDLNPIDYPEIHDVDFKDGSLCFTAKIEVKPEVVIKDKDYKGVKVKRGSVEVTDEDINKTFDYFKQAQTQGKDKDKEVKIDDDFAKGLGYPSLEEFKKVLTRQIEMDKDRQNKIDVENQVVDALLKKAKFKTPESLVKRQLEQRVAQQLEQMKKYGAKEEDIQKQEEEMRKTLKDLVERDVRAYFVFDKIAELESIKPGENETIPAKVMEYLLKEATWEEAKNDKRTKK